MKPKYPQNSVKLLVLTTLAILYTTIGCPSAYSSSPAEQTTRACIAKRTQELLSSKKTLGGEMGTPNSPTQKCGDPLMAELKAQGKTYCEAIVYVAWVTVSEQMKPFGLPQKPFEGETPSYMARCETTQGWAQHK
jgi:hypothetical protein